MSVTPDLTQNIGQDPLEHVMDRKATTIKDYRGYVRGHFEPFFRDRPVHRTDEGWVTAYLKHKRGEGCRPRLSTTT